MGLYTGLYLDGTGSLQIQMEDICQRSSSHKRQLILEAPYHGGRIIHFDLTHTKTLSTPHSTQKQPPSFTP